MCAQYSNFIWTVIACRQHSNPMSNFHENAMTYQKKKSILVIKYMLHLPHLLFATLFISINVE